MTVIISLRGVIFGKQNPPPIWKINTVAKNPPILSQIKNAFMHRWKSNTTERSQCNAQCAADGGFPGGYEMLCVKSEIRPVQSTTDSPARLQIVHIITLTLATDFGVNVGGEGRRERGERYNPNPWTSLILSRPMCE